MAPFVCGRDLAEINGSRCKSGHVWNGEHHLRRTKLVVYQCALLFCIVSESLGTAVLSDYIDQHHHVQARWHGQAHVHNHDYVGAGSYNTFAGVFVAFIFGAAFFFDLLWPERQESRSVRTAWRVCGVLATVFQLASALALTIVTARRRSYVTGVSRAQAEEWTGQREKSGGAPLMYRHNRRAVAAVVFAWLGWVSVFASCVLLFFSIRHSELSDGPQSRHAQHRDQAASDPEAQHSESEKSIRVPERSYQPPAHATEQPWHATSAAERSPTYKPGTVDADAAGMA